MKAYRHPDKMTPKDRSRNFLDTECPTATQRLLTEISRCTRIVLARKFPDLRPAEREDVEQEINLKMWKSISHGKKIEQLESYLWKAVTTTALDVLESRWREVSLDEYLKKNGPDRALSGLVNEPDLEAFDLRRHLRDLIKSLPAKRRVVLNLHLAGMDLAETARYLRWTLPKTRHLFYRGLSDLRKKYDKEKRMGAETTKGKSDENWKDGLPAAGKVREVLSE